MQMNKRQGTSADILAENIQKIKRLFPEVFTEDKIDFERLQVVLGEYVEDKEERYRFEWNGKSKALRLAQTQSTGTLRPCKTESKDWDTTENLYVEGDNLEVLKLLQKSYHSKIKMIYIDPPYNTGKDFVYPDNYRDNLQNYLEITGQKNDEGRKISTNSETNGRYHTDWLNMMYPRLRLARNLLTDDGVIFISIDDNEVDNLKKICNELFGEDNFVADLIWMNKEGGGSSDSRLFRIKHEHILVFSKRIVDINIIGTQVSNEERYSSQDEFVNTRGKYYLQKLGMGSIQYSASLDYIIKAPDGTDIHPKDNNSGKKACWRWSKEKFDWGVQNKYIEIKKDNSGIWTVYSKQYLNADNDGNLIKRTQRPMGVIEEYSSTQGSKLLVNMGLADYFSYSKPIQLLEYLITRLDTNNSTILDFFSGSATTAHATMQLNAEDGGNRKFIMVQLPELTDENSEAYKAGYKNICEIGKERIRRAGEKIKEEIESEPPRLDEEPRTVPDIGFKVFKLDSSNLKKWNPDYDNLEKTLGDMVDNYLEGRTEEDVLYEIILKYGIDLTLPVQTEEVNGQKVFSIGSGALFICLADKITMEIADYIIVKKDELQPEVTRVVFKDNGFENDDDKTNVEMKLERHGFDEVVSV